MKSLEPEMIAARIALGDKCIGKARKLLDAGRPMQAFEALPPGAQLVMCKHSENSLSARIYGRSHRDGYDAAAPAPTALDAVANAVNKCIEMYDAINVAHNFPWGGYEI